MLRAAYSLIELLLCLGLTVVVSGVAAPGLMAARDAVRADGATEYLSSLLHGTRMEALKRRAHVAVRFEDEADGYWMALYLDGDGNGVRSADIASGTDRLLRPRERLDHQYPDVSFGLAPGVPDVDGAPAGDNADPIRVGRSRMLSFGPLGTSSSGTVYLHGRGRRQAAVRVLGATGRVRSLRFDFALNQWVSR